MSLMRLLPIGGVAQREAQEIMLMVKGMLPRLSLNTDKVEKEEDSMRWHAVEAEELDNEPLDEGDKFQIFYFLKELVVRHPIRLKLLIERILRVQGFDSLLLRPLRRKIEMEELSQLLEKAWAEEPEPVDRIEENQQDQEKERKILFLGKKEITPRSDIVLYENGIFFIELVSGSFVIRPKYMREYLRVKGRRGNKRYTKFTRAANPIVIPMMTVRENPIRWFEQNYLSNVKRNQQGAFIKAIWKHRHEFMPMLMMG